MTEIPRWDMLLRFRLIEVIAYWEGRLTTNHLQDAFGIGRQQASKDINAYTKGPGVGNLAYDRSKKGYVPTKQFKPLYTKGRAAEYLQIVSTRGDVGGIYAGNTTASVSTEILQPPLRQLSPPILRQILGAIREGLRLSIQYGSLGNPKPQFRIIQPHTVVFNGLRWHLRAYCERKKTFSDFVISRITSVPAPAGQATIGIEQDEAWQANVRLEFVPDPRLNKDQRQLIAKDYGMESGKLIVETRGALVSYVLQNLRVETESEKRTPEMQQIVLKNRNDVEHWMFKPNKNNKAK